MLTDAVQGKILILNEMVLLVAMIMIMPILFPVHVPICMGTHHVACKCLMIDHQ